MHPNHALPDSSYDEHRIVVERYKEWLFRADRWADAFLSTPDKPFDVSRQQHQAFSAYNRLVRAKYKRAEGLPMTAAEQSDADKFGISIQAGHGLGKDMICAVLGLHALMCLPEPKVMVTAPAGPQLHAVIWPEFAKWIKHSEKLERLVHHQNNLIYLKELGGDRFFIKPRTIQPTADQDAQAETLAGLHSYSMIRIIDEASGVPEPVFKPLEGGGTDPITITILIYNPTRRTGYAIDTQGRNRKYWLCLHWSGEELRQEKLDRPGRLVWFNENAQLAIKEKWGVHSNFYRVRVQGYPPSQAPDTLIPWDWIEEAKNRTLEPAEFDPLVLGVDVGGEGSDRTVIIGRRGPKILTPILEYTHMRQEQIAYRVEEALEEWDHKDSPIPATIGIDSQGIGRGVYEWLKYTRRLPRVYGIDVNRDANKNDVYYRLRDEMWGLLRDTFEAGLIDIPDHDDLFGQLCLLTTEDKGGLIKVVSKMKLRSQGLPSPDHADALAMTELVLRRHAPKAYERDARSPRPLRRGRHHRPVSWRVQ